MMSEVKALTLTEDDRAVLGKRKILAADRERLPHLWVPFRDTYCTHVRPAAGNQDPLLAAFRFCGQTMLTLDCTYWAFTWERLLPWHDAVVAREAGRPVL